MSNISEIEAAIEKLSTPDVLALSRWLEELKQQRCATPAARPLLVDVLHEVTQGATYHRTREDIDAELRHERQSWE